MNIKRHDTAFDLAKESFGNGSHEITYEEALSNGVLINVTGWVRHEMGFAENRYRVDVAITARLWKTIVRVSPLAKVWQTVVGRGNDVLWLASYALQKARQVGLEMANFESFLPTEDDYGTECIKHLCAKRRIHNGKSVIVIGYADEFLSS